MNRLMFAGMAACSLAAMFHGAPAIAQGTAEPVRIDISAGSLADAITQLSMLTGVQILAPGDLVRGRQTPGLHATLTAEQALERLVDPFGLVIQRTGQRALSLAAAAPPTGRVPSSVEELVVTGSYTRRQANTATGLNMTLRETPQSVTVITHERMGDQNLTEISEVLNQAIGVTYDGSTLGSDGDKFYGRGFTVTNYQIDGIPRPAGIYGFQTTTSDMAIYDRIEIVRGATGLMNGVGNPSASINMIRKRPTDENFAGSLSMQAGSWGRRRLGAEVSGALTDGGAVRGLLAASHQQSESHIDRIELEKTAFGGVLELDVTPRTLVTVGFEHQEFENHQAPRGGVPLFFSDGSVASFPRSTNTSAYWGDLANSRDSLFAELEQRIGDRWLLKIVAEHVEPEYDEVMGYLGAGFDPVTGEGGALYSARWAGDLEQDFVAAFFQGAFSWLGRDHEVVVGLTDSTSGDSGFGYCGWWCGPAYNAPLTDGYAFLTDGRSGGVVMPNLSGDGSRYGGEITQRSAYGAVRLKPSERFALVFGGRVTDWKETEYNESPDGERTYSPVNEETGVFTPYFGFVADVSAWLSAYASYTQIFEPQNRAEPDGTKLDPLEGTNYEAGFKAEFFDTRLSASLGIFRIEQDNSPVYIPGVLTPDGDYAYRAEDGAVSEGFEIEVAGELVPGWQMVGGYSRAKPRDAEGENMLPYLPENNFKLFTSYAFDGRLDGLTLGGNVRWQSKATTDGPNDASYTQGSRTVVDLLVKYALSERATVQANANNVLDEKYFSSLGWSANYGEPRNVSASFTWKF